MPVWDAVERHAVEVARPVETVYRAVRALDLTGSRLVRLLFFLRRLPLILRRPASPRRRGLTLDALLGSGFILLGETPPHELAVGIAGRFWTATGDVQRLDVPAFRAFDRPGYAKAVWNFTLDGDARLTRLATETRVRCLDAPSRARFTCYWRIVGPFSGLVRMQLLGSIKRQAEAV